MTTSAAGGASRVRGGPLADLGQAVLAVLLPPRCKRCEVPLVSHLPPGLCGLCLESLTPNDGPRCRTCDLPGTSPCASCNARPPPFAHLRAPYLYGGLLAELVQAAKFTRREDVAQALGHLLAEQLAGLTTAGVQGIVPVPLGRRRRRQRGYNPSATLARCLGRRLGLPVLHLLRRSRETAPQSALPLSARRANVEGAFMAEPAAYEHLLLVDDVVTSGETMRQAAAALRQAGIAHITAVALGRTPLGDH